MATALAIPQVHSKEITDSVWQEAAWLPCLLSVGIAVCGFTVGDLLSLEVGSVVDAGIPSESEASVEVSGVRVGCGKLAATGEHRAVRLSELV
jgi:hypothetical protein